MASSILVIMCRGSQVFACADRRRWAWACFRSYSAWAVFPSASNVAMSLSSGERLLSRSYAVGSGRLCSPSFHSAAVLVPKRRFLSSSSSLRLLSCLPNRKLPALAGLVWVSQRPSSSPAPIAPRTIPSSCPGWRWRANVTSGSSTRWLDRRFKIVERNWHDHPRELVCFIIFEPRQEHDGFGVCARAPARACSVRLRRT